MPEDLYLRDVTRDGDVISFRSQDVDDAPEYQHQVYWYVCGIHLTFQCDTAEHSQQLFELLKTVKITDVD